MSWYGLKEDFIEGAARAMFVSAWADYMENNCAHCGENVEEQHSLGNLCEDDPKRECKGHSFPGVELMDIAPEAPREAKYEAAILLGKIEQLNGVSLAVVVHRARVADCVEDGTHKHEGSYLNQHDGPGEDRCKSIDVKDFGHYLAMQSLGHGVSWFDDHAQFDLKLPHIEFYYEEVK